MENDLYFAWSGQPRRMKADGRHSPSQRTSTSFKVWRYRRAANSCFAPARIMLPFPSPASAFASSAVVLSSPANSSHKAERKTLARGRDSLLMTEAAARQDPRVIDARVSIVSRPGCSAAFSVTDLQGPPTLEPST